MSQEKKLLGEVLRDKVFASVKDALEDAASVTDGNHSIEHWLTEAVKEHAEEIADAIRWDYEPELDEVLHAEA